MDSGLSTTWATGKKVNKICADFYQLITKRGWPQRAASFGFTQALPRISQPHTNSRQQRRNKLPMGYGD